jgi:hypothetical protein
MQLGNGDMLVGGDFALAANGGGAYLARLTTTCPALAVSAGSGCSGSGGPNVLTAQTLPWIGSTFHSVATGMPANGLGVRVLGFTTAAAPLSAILPQGHAGCSLLVAPALLELHLPVAGSIATQLALPNTIALATQTFHDQIIAFEIAASGAITALTSTNALTLTIGAF